MKKAFKKLMVSVMALAILLASNASLVEAKESNDNNGVMYEQSVDAVSPLKNYDQTYPFGRSATTYHVGTVYKGPSSKLELRMSNDNGKSYLQGNISLSPMTGGSSYDIRFANYSTEDYFVDLSGVPDGAYFLYITAAVVGSSGTGSVRLIYTE